MILIPSRRVRSLALGLLGLMICLTTSCASDVDVEKLYVQANSDDYEERVEARQKLGDLVLQGRVEPFARGLHSENAETRVQSILHLMAIKSPESTHALVGELALPRHFNVYYNPIRLVPVSNPADSRIMIAHIILMNGGDPKAVEMLAESYGQEPDTETRVGTLYALGALNDRAAIPVLRKGLKDPDLKVVKAAMEGLSQLEVPDVSESLIQGLADSNETVRINSASALAGFHNKEISAALLETLRKDPSENVRLAAIGGLANAAGPEAFAPILALLKSREAGAEIKNKAAAALQSLTNQDFGQDAVKWARWWDQNHDKLGQR